MESADLQTLAALVPTGSRVLDLGCGTGEWLAYLMRERGCTGYGVEIDDANVQACLARGVNVIQLNLEEGLALFADSSFDVVLQIDTLQHLRNTEVMLQETARVGRTAIVAFPNFAHWPNRLAVLRGRMPVTKVLPYQWYDTPNIHFCTVRDFDDFCRDKNIDVITRTVVDNKHRDSAIIRAFPNLLSEIAIYHFARGQQGGQ